ncbi:unnamed protein product [Pleuronectes platessa]|uniref:Uncharacterized protein n=1 Tax=Pleuronectes platessa TaxID=8262 RepID=A0A9N7VJ71_PLEPL|nr:unnamed protein product [Pleuronectes platessa]
MPLGAGKNPSAHLAPSFPWTELKTCREGGFNSLQSSAVGNQLMIQRHVPEIMPEDHCQSSEPQERGMLSAYLSATQSPCFRLTELVAYRCEVQLLRSWCDKGEM